MCLHSFPAPFNQIDGDHFSQYREQYERSDVDFFVLLGWLCMWCHSTRCKAGPKAEVNFTRNITDLKNANVAD